MSPAGDGTQLLQRATAYDSVGRSIQRCSALARCAGASTPTKPCLLHSGCPMTLASWSEDNKSKATWPAKRLSKVLPAVSGEPSIETSDPELRDALEILKDLGGFDRAHTSRRNVHPARRRPGGGAVLQMRLEGEHVDKPQPPIPELQWRPRPMIPLEEACVTCLTFARPWPIHPI